MVQDRPWEPANEVEQQLRAAAERQDAADVLGIIAGAPLVLPGFSEPPAGYRQRVLTRKLDGVPYLLVFTSVEALRAAVNADGWRQVSLPELVRDWYRLAEEPWGLAINPGTPVEVLVEPQAVPDLLPDLDALAAVTPANQTELALRDALAAADGEVLLDVLAMARVVVPTEALTLDGTPTVPVFTARQRGVDFLAAAGLAVPLVELDLSEVLRQWPGEEYRLAVNPGSPLGFSLDSERVSGLLAHAVALVERLRAEGHAAAAAPEP